MARLTMKQRKKMPKSKFAGPGTSFPVNDKEHVQKAVQLAKYASPATKKKIKAAAKKMGVNAPSLGLNLKKKGKRKKKK